MARVIPVEDVRYTPAVALLEGHAEVPVSVCYVGASDDAVRVVSVHPSPEVEQTNL